MQLHKRTLQQLIELRRTIDRSAEPAKAEQIDRLISLRAEERANTLLAREKEGPFDNAAKAYLRGVVELVVGVVFGLLLLRLEPFIAFQQWRPMCYLEVVHD
ncbi:MAG: hypothetical protein DHS20C11_24700 [Lysobacteraceae bacterium]|nr:MAG: hypothetical protein DHS20C11_24700 [Xanthomonadaceae bacterium]